MAERAGGSCLELLDVQVLGGLNNNNNNKKTIMRAPVWVQELTGDNSHLAGNVDWNHELDLGALLWYD